MTKNEEAFRKKYKVAASCNSPLLRIEIGDLAWFSWIKWDEAWQAATARAVGVLEGMEGEYMQLNTSFAVRVAGALHAAIKELSDG